MQKLDALLGVYLKKAKEDGKKIFFYKRKENNFWNEEKGCLKKNQIKKM